MAKGGKTEVAAKKVSIPKKTTIRGEGKYTAGWKEAAPKKGLARKALMKQCGPKAFLNPLQLKFPVVAQGDKTCKPDCRGVQSALVRARQWSYKRTAAKAEKMLTDLKCPSRAGLLIKKKRVLKSAIKKLKSPAHKKKRVTKSPANKKKRVGSALKTTKSPAHKKKRVSSAQK